MNNKTIMKFGILTMKEIMKASEDVIHLGRSRS